MIKTPNSYANECKYNNIQVGNKVNWYQYKGKNNCKHSFDVELFWKIGLIFLTSAGFLLFIKYINIYI